MPVQDFHIKKIRVENYKSLKNSEIELKEGLNIIIGKNGAGKSNLLDFIIKYASYTRIPLRQIYTDFSVSLEYGEKKRKQHMSYSIKRLRPASNKSIPYSYELTYSLTDGVKELIKNQKFKFNSDIGSEELFETQNLPVEFQSFRRFGSNHISFSTPEKILWVATPGKIAIDINIDNPILTGEYSSLKLFSQIQIEIQKSDFEDIVRNEYSQKGSVVKMVSALLSGYLNQTSINDALERYTIIKKLDSIQTSIFIKLNRKY